jgi:hypothetical protein
VTPNRRRVAVILSTAFWIAREPRGADAHEGPPFPIVQDLVAGAYRLSVWTDPDATDDGSAGGSFWVIVHAAAGVDPDAGTRVTVTARPLDREGPPRTAGAAPQVGAPSRFFARVVLDHEADWRVEISVDGPMGQARTSADVAATYNLRPPLITLPFLVLPFLLVGCLWLTALRRRRQGDLKPDRS